MTAPLTTHEWAAGIIDGEGCFSLNGYKSPGLPKYKPRKDTVLLDGKIVWPVLCVTQASHRGKPEMLLRLQSLYGGNIGGPFYKGHVTPQYHLLLSSKLVQHALLQFWPWLGEVKRAQALSVGFKAPNS